MLPLDVVTVWIVESETLGEKPVFSCAIAYRVSIDTADNLFDVVVHRECVVIPFTYGRRQWRRS